MGLYMLTLGEFSYDGYSKGINSRLAWVFFVLATFICCIVFMNMLIAIMGETFGSLQENMEQSARSEQVALLKDFLWLLDIQKKYDKDKYIICIESDKGVVASELTISERID